MFTFKESFADLTTNAWLKDTSVVIASNEVTSTATSQQAWKALSETIAVGKPFRLDTRFRIIDGTGPNDDGYVGFSSEVAGTRSANTKWVAIGYSAVSGISAYHAAGIGGSGLTTLISVASTIKGNYYRAGIVSDGVTMTFWVCDDSGGGLVATKMAAPTVILNNTFVNFNDITGLSVDRLGIINDLDGYNDVNFNERLRFYAYTGGATENERAYIECPDTYKKSTKSRFAIYSHGSSGTPEDFIGGLTGERNFRKDFVGQGYVFAVSMAHGNNWGSNSVVADNRLLRDYMQSKLNLFYKGFVIGQSMGGLGACLTALQYPHMFAAIGLVYPVMNLDWMYYALNSSSGSYVTPINTAYGCDNTTYHRLVQGHNVHDRVDELYQFPLKSWHGDADVTVGYRHSQDIVNGITALGGTASLVTIVGGVHGAAGAFDPVAMAAHFNTVVDANLGQPASVKHSLQGGIRLS